MKTRSGRRPSAWAAGLAGLLVPLAGVAQEPGKLPASLMMTREPAKIVAVQTGGTGPAVQLDDPTFYYPQVVGPGQTVVTGPPAGPVIVPAPVDGTVGPGDPYPTFYRDRPKGSAMRKAETIVQNRSNEPPWYRDWRCRYYGYYPTQWRPFPEGWHSGRNVVYRHPYDLRPPQATPPTDTKAPPPANSTPIPPKRPPGGT